MTFDHIDEGATQGAPEYEEPRLIDLGSLDDVTRGHTKPKAKDNKSAMGSKP